MHLQKNVQFFLMCIDLYHSSLLSFIEISIKVTPLQQIVPIMSINLITWGEFGEILPTNLKSVAKLLIHYIYKWWLYYEQGWMGENNWNFNYFLIKFSDFDQINIGRVAFDLFYHIVDKICQLVTCNQLQYINNRTYKHGFSTKW